ncbi:MAG: phosphate ABC transporter permease subunit PstC [Candidatus Symbiothrix sp.]|nr:phosphate ABC transporter permease subunit PstC [Candidatus Symbiothrix sp.]
MKDLIFKIAQYFSVLLVLLVVGGIFFTLFSGSIPAFKQFGVWHFITSDAWYGDEERYGALAFIAGTFATATLALAVSIPFSLSLSLFCAELYKGKKIASYTGYVVNLLANIPSIILGVWGYYSLRPLLVSLNFDHFGYGIFTSSLILAMMIIPYSSSMIMNFIARVPRQLKESAYSLGATRFEVIRLVGLPNAMPGIYKAFIISYVKVLGECMIVIMLIGNTNHLPEGITGTGNTMASIIFNQFGVTSDIKLSSLLAIALLLFLVTALFNLWAGSLGRRSAA